MRGKEFHIATFVHEKALVLVYLGGTVLVQK